MVTPHCIFKLPSSFPKSIKLTNGLTPPIKDSIFVHSPK